MPRKECSVMGERLSFVARRPADDGTLQGVRKILGFCSLENHPRVLPIPEPIAYFHFASPSTIVM
jgi:hypothetical protein